LGGEGSEPVGFVVTDVTDSGDRRRRVRERGDGGQGGGEFTGRRQVEVDAGNPAPARDGELVALERDGGTEAGEEIEKFGSDLRGLGGPAGNGHGSAGDDGCGEERGGVGEVGLDPHVATGDSAGLHSPDPYRG